MNKDQYIGAFTAVFGLLVIFLLVPIGVDLDEVEADTQTLVRPDFWPNVIGGLMIVIGTIYTIISRTKHGSEATPEAGPDAAPASSDDASPGFQIEPRRALAIVAVMLLFALTSDDTGLFLPAIAMFVVSAVGYGGGRTVYIVVGAILVPVLLQQFFERVANIPVPLGVLEGILG